MSTPDTLTDESIIRSYAAEPIFTSRMVPDRLLLGVFALRANKGGFLSDAATNEILAIYGIGPAAEPDVAPDAAEATVKPVKKAAKKAATA